MREKIQNRLLIVCDDIDLQTVTNIEFYVKQPRFHGSYTPEVLSASEMVVVIPYEDAMRLRAGEVDLQFAFVDADGNPRASETAKQNVGVFLKEAGYDPI